MKNLVLLMSVVALLSACGSAVKLDKVPVEDKSGQMVNAGSTATGTNDGAGVAKSNVATVTLDKNAQDPALSAALRTVYFDYDSFVIRAEFQSTLEAHAKYLKADKSRKVSIEGHTDERGGREYNLALGQKRAEAVRKALQLQGVSDAQMEAISYGKEKPAVLGNSEAALEKNRRAEFSYR
ncbi:MAG: peptidoglycan-associated lipoprotein Pal [Betaproteobacteria bacterium]|nr:peptidoglycan-associated lipoprotein Pal [Betaproteobacteria bacterium]